MTLSLKDRINTIFENENFEDDKEVIMKIKTLLAELEDETSDSPKSKSLAQIFQDGFDLLVKPPKLISTSIKAFDDKFGGLALGEFVVLGARPSMGKTSLVTQLASQISKEVPTLFFSFNLSEKQLFYRFLALEKKIDAMGFYSRSFLEEHWVDLVSLKDELEAKKLFFNISGVTTLSDFRKECEKYIKENKVKVIIVDCLQDLSSSKRWNNREIEMGLICRELKKISREYGVCVIATSPLSRATEFRPGKRPQLSDLRESGSIEQEADKVILIYRPEYYDIEYWDNEDMSLTENEAELILAKNKMGMLGSVRVRFNKNLGIFENSENNYKIIGDFSFLESRLGEIGFENEDNIPF